MDCKNKLIYIRVIRLLGFTFLIGSIMPLFAQIRRDISNKQVQLKIVRPVVVKTPSVAKGTKGRVKSTAIKKEEPEYLLFRNVMRRNLWLEGVGEPISQEVADKLPLYFRLSMKSKGGHFQFVEALRGEKLTAEHNVVPYLLNFEKCEDEDINEWKDKFAAVAQWMFSSDAAGEHVLEERAYEAKENDANLVYSFIPVYNDTRHITASYNDSWGLPIDVDPKEEYLYGNVVRITLDSEGRDSIVDYHDAKGYVRFNEFDVPRITKEYDSEGRIKNIAARNPVNDRINDIRGVCGVTYEYSSDGKSFVELYVDKDFNPVKVSSPGPEGENYGSRVSLDEYGRPALREFLSAERGRGESENGVSYIKYTYMADGTPNLTYYDKDSNIKSFI